MSEMNLLAVYARTAAGDGELASPANGLSINQRKLLQWCDGNSMLSELVERLGSGQTVDATKVARDVERLEALGLVSVVGGAAKAKPIEVGKTFGSKKKVPWWLAGAGACVLVGGLVAFARQSPDPAASHAQQPVGGEMQQASLETTESEGRIFGVMPNPARWFSPGKKEAPAPKPVEEKPAAKPETKPEPAVADAKQAKPELAKPVVAAAAVPAPVTQTTAPATLAVDPAAKPAPAAAPVQLASAQPMLAKPEVPAAPNKKPIYREAPEFPREAMRDGIESGLVKARISVNEAGQVVKVDILESKPRRVFDRAVVSALSKWRFQPAAAGFSVDTEINFTEN